MFDPALKGHLELRRRLWQRLEGGSLPGSLLLVGPEAIGKRRVAMELAQRELCLRRNACGICEGCRSFKSEPLSVEWPNLLRIAPEGKAGLIRIGVIREDDLVEGGVIGWAHQAAPMGCHRFILVEDAHRLNDASANMLLKTLEEPPASTHFLLVTHRPEAVLPTIRSRAERVSFTRLEDEEAWAIAREALWEEADRDRWLSLSGGTLRYLDPEAFARGLAQLEAWLDVLEGKPFGLAKALLPEKDSTLSQNEQLGRTLELLLLILADVLRIREGHAPRLHSWKERLQGVSESSRDFNESLRLVFESMRNLIRNPFAESMLREVAMMI